MHEDLGGVSLCGDRIEKEIYIPRWIEYVGVDIIVSPGMYRPAIVAPSGGVNRCRPPGTGGCSLRTSIKIPVR